MKAYGQINKRLGWASGNKASRKKSSKVARQFLKKEINRAQVCDRIMG